MSLKSIRLQRHLSQEALAKLSGLNVRTIQRIEVGNNPSVESLKCLAAALDIDIADISSDIDESNIARVSAVDELKHHANSIFYLLSGALIFVVIGANLTTTDGSVLGAILYVLAAIFLIFSAYKMFKHRFGM